MKTIINYVNESSKNINEILLGKNTETKDLGFILYGPIYAKDLKNSYKKYEQLAKDFGFDINKENTWQNYWEDSEQNENQMVVLFATLKPEPNAYWVQYGEPGIVKYYK